MRLLARTAHDATIARGVVFVRQLTVAYGLAYLALWHTWYGGAPLRLAASVVVLVWTAAFTVAVARRGPTSRLLASDLAIVVAVAGLGGLLVPPETVGDAANWAFVLVGVAAASAASLLPLSRWLPAMTAIGVAYLSGSLAVGVSGPSAGVPTRSVLSLVLLCVALSFATGMLRRQAADADERLRSIADRRREEAVAEARARDRREQERILHDTILNTLTGIAWGAAAADSRAAVRDRCRMDVTDIEAFLAVEPHDPATADLVEALTRAVQRVRQRGLAVDMRVAGRCDVRPAVADAVAAAVAEALANVARHAGVGRAEVVAEPNGGTSADGDVPGAGVPGAGVPGAGVPGAGVPGAGVHGAGVHGDAATVDVPLGGGAGGTVVVRDRGRGFDPARVRADRIGIRRSINERMIDVGGTATVASSPGEGTTVTLRWAS